MFIQIFNNFLYLYQFKIINFLLYVDLILLFILVFDKFVILSLIIFYHTK